MFKYVVEWANTDGRYGKQWQPGEAGGSRDDFTHSVGQLPVPRDPVSSDPETPEEEWLPSEVTVLMDGFMSGWHGRLPQGWFTYIDDWEISNVTDKIACGIVPLVGTLATMIWVGPKGPTSKTAVVNAVKSIRQTIADINAESIVFFVTCLPLNGPGNMRQINFNKNLTFAVRGLRRKAGYPDSHIVGLHHWCLKQGTAWGGLHEVTDQQKSMLLWLITDSVCSKLGLAPSSVL